LTASLMSDCWNYGIVPILRFSWSTSWIRLW